jgi:hypothetical protein
VIFWRRVSLSPTADLLIRQFASRERMDPDVFASLVLENAIRERDELERRFRAAAAKVANVEA